MAHVTLLFTATVSLLTALAYAAVGRAIATKRRATSAAATRAVGFYAAWWRALAAIMLLDAVVVAAAAFDLADVPLLTAQMTASIVLASVAFASLFYYVLFVLTGGARTLAPTLVYYGAIAVAGVYDVARLGPSATHITAWTATLGLERSAAEPLTVGIAVAFLAPALVGALRFAWLSRAVQDPTARYRIRMGTVSMMAWVLLFALQPLAYAGDDGILEPTARALALVAALLVLLAYMPPRFVQRRLRVQSLLDQ